MEELVSQEKLESKHREKTNWLSNDLLKVIWKVKIKVKLHLKLKSRAIQLL